MAAMIGAHLSGFAAHVFDRLAATYLPQLMPQLDEQQRAEILAAREDLRQSAALWERSRTTTSGTAAVPDDTGGAAFGTNEVTVAEAVTLLGLQARQVRNIAQRWKPDGTARKVAGAWLMDRVSVEVVAQERRGRSA